MARRPSKVTKAESVCLLGLLSAWFQRSEPTLTRLKRRLRREWRHNCAQLTHREALAAERTKERDATSCQLARPRLAGQGKPCLVWRVKKKYCGLLISLS